MKLWKKIANNLKEHDQFVIIIRGTVHKICVDIDINNCCRSVFRHLNESYLDLRFMVDEVVISDKTKGSVNTLKFSASFEKFPWDDCDLYRFFKNEKLLMVSPDFVLLKLSCMKDSRARCSMCYKAVIGNYAGDIETDDPTWQPQENYDDVNERRKDPTWRPKGIPKKKKKNYLYDITSPRSNVKAYTKQPNIKNTMIPPETFFKQVHPTDVDTDESIDQSTEKRTIGIVNDVRTPPERSNVCINSDPQGLMGSKKKKISIKLFQDDNPSLFKKFNDFEITAKQVNLNKSLSLTDIPKEPLCSSSFINDNSRRMTPSNEQLVPESSAWGARLNNGPISCLSDVQLTEFPVLHKGINNLGVQPSSPELTQIESTLVQPFAYAFEGDKVPEKNCQTTLNEENDIVNLNLVLEVSPEINIVRFSGMDSNDYQKESTNFNLVAVEDKAQNSEDRAKVPEVEEGSIINRKGFVTKEKTNIKPQNSIPAFENDLMDIELPETTEISMFSNENNAINDSSVPASSSSEYLNRKSVKRREFSSKISSVKRTKVKSFERSKFDDIIADSSSESGFNFNPVDIFRSYAELSKLNTLRKNCSGEYKKRPLHHKDSEESHFVPDSSISSFEKTTDWLCSEKFDKFSSEEEMTKKKKSEMNNNSFDVTDKRKSLINQICSELERDVNSQTLASTSRSVSNENTVVVSSCSFTDEESINNDENESVMSDVSSIIPAVNSSLIADYCERVRVKEFNASAKRRSKIASVNNSFNLDKALDTVINILDKSINEDQTRDKSSPSSFSSSSAEKSVNLTSVSVCRSPFEPFGASDGEMIFDVRNSRDRNIIYEEELIENMKLQELATTAEDNNGVTSTGGWSIFNPFEKLKKLFSW